MKPSLFEILAYICQISVSILRFLPPAQNRRVGYNFIYNLSLHRLQRDCSIDFTEKRLNHLL